MNCFQNLSSFFARKLRRYLQINLCCLSAIICEVCIIQFYLTFPQLINPSVPQSHKTTTYQTIIFMQNTLPPLFRYS